MRLPILCLLIMSVTLPVCLAQSQGDLPLGDVARLYRKEKKAPEHTVIDNENLTEFMDEIQSRKFTSSLLFSFDTAGKNFKVSSPDVTCSLSFNGQSSSLLSDPYVSRDLPGDELAKLDGPAVIQGKTLQVSVYNGSDWKIRELTVGLTLVRRSPQAPYGPPRLQPAAEKTVESAEKLSDRTVLYHLKGMAAPNATTLFTEDLTVEPGPDQEWHWAIVGAKGIPPVTLPEASSLAAPVAPEASISVGPSAGSAPAIPTDPR
jgi:hypothetical protein